MTTKDLSTIMDRDVRPWWRCPEAWLLSVLVLSIFLSRLAVLPVAGEEPRWAGCASLMLETGDWIVPRQQGVIYPDRPPLGCWTIAITAWLRGQMDAVAVRLPSVLAIWITSLAIFAYARGFLSATGSLASALAYATCGQVLQLGRLGENEAVYTMLLGGAMLAWHACYWQGRSPWLAWCSGYALAAGAFLVKGPQAPVYFGAAATVFLACRRDWRWLFAPAHGAGILLHLAIVSSWLIPFYLRTDGETTIRIIGLSSAARYTWIGLWKHLAAYPLETFGCLMPWSILVVGLSLRRVRAEVGKLPTAIVFVLTASAVTYPSVWMAAGARGRYFMPLYPCLAVVVGWMTDRLVHSSPGSVLRQAWNLAMRSGILAAVLLGAAILIASIVPAGPWSRVAQPLSYAVLLAAASVLVAAALYRSLLDAAWQRGRIAILSVAAYAGFGYTGIMINSQLNVANDLARPVAELKQRLERSGTLVSFGAADHRFCYYYGTTIPELPWPAKLEDVPAGVTYFCFTRLPTDTPEKRTSGRFWNWTTTSGTLPFAWEEVAVISCDRKRSSSPSNKMVIGRMVRTSAVVAGVGESSGTVDR